MPGAARKVLKQFTLNYAVGGPSAGSSVGHNPSTWFEFSGCALFPKRSDERSAAHCLSILASQELLEACGYPNLLETELDEKSCVAIADAAGVKLK